MDKRKAIEAAGSEAVANPDNASEQPQPRIELPSVESPSISPAELRSGGRLCRDCSLCESTEAATAGTAPRRMHLATLSEFTAPKRARFILRPRHKRYALLAASVAIAAALGAVVGAATTGGFSKAPRCRCCRR